MSVGQIVWRVQDRLLEKAIVHGLTRINCADLVSITEVRTITQRHTITRDAAGWLLGRHPTKGYVAAANYIPGARYLH
jgi:hypothetical protein